MDAWKYQIAPRFISRVTWNKSAWYFRAPLCIILYLITRFDSHSMIVSYIDNDNYACDVTLSVYPHQAGLKNMPGHGPAKVNVNVE